MSETNGDLFEPEPDAGDAVPAVVPRSADPLATVAPEPFSAEMLVAGLRRLQQRIPDYVQLSTSEIRAKGNAANLDEDFVIIGIQAAAAWHGAKFLYTAEQLREMADDARRWDEVELELRVLLKGVSGANLKRKHILGVVILTIYDTMRRSIKVPGMEYLRPYYEEMKAAWLRSRTMKRRKKEPEAAKE
jgi:hypothetical protein